MNNISNIPDKPANGADQIVIWIIVAALAGMGIFGAAVVLYKFMVGLA